MTAPKKPNGSPAPALMPRPLKAATLVFFAGYLALGLSLYRDYGLTWDELPTREFGIMYVQHLVPDLRALDSLRAVSGPAYERFGPLYEIMLVKTEQMLLMTDSRAVFQMRHLATFLTFFLGVVLFHRLCLRRFGGGIALLASVSLVASPQLFSHAFYNTKDIAFLTAFIGVMLTLDVVLARPAWRALLVHAVTTAALLGTRVLGLFAMMITGAAMLVRRPNRQSLLMLSAYGAIVAVLLPVVWPVLRIDPIGIVKGAVLGSTTNPYTRTNLFRGMTIPAAHLPWDYVPTWIAVTTPMVLTVLFAVGSGLVIAACVRSPRRALFEDQRDAIVLGWFFAPVLGTVVLRPVMYDGWRHLFFVYPAFVYLAAVAMEWLAAAAAKRFATMDRRALWGGLTGALLLGLSPAVAFMVANHPLEHLYFNRLAGPDMATVKQRFELDYWGTSYLQTLEYIARTDTARLLRVRAANFPGMVNSLMLPDRDRSRFKFTGSDSTADYFVTNYRYHPEAYPYANEVFQVRVGNAAAASVFRLHSTP